MTRGMEGARIRLDPAFQSVAEAVAGAGLPPMVDLSPDEARQRVRGTTASCAPGPDVGAVTAHTIGDHIAVRLYRPHTTTSASTVVHFHGGGWVTGDLEYADAICRAIAETAGATVVSVDYRLAPEHRFPAAIDDAMAVLRWVAAGSEDLGRSVVVTGDSAGGNLAAVCANLARDDEEIDLVGQVLIYPVVDTDLDRDSYATNSGVFLGAREMQWFLDHYCPEAAPRTSPMIAPIRALDLSGLPSTVVVVGGHDPLLDEGLEYAQRLSEAGVRVELLRYPSLPHGFLQFTAASSAAAAAAGEIVAAIARIIETVDVHKDSEEGSVHA
ncbi:alpha/beta hydrolase [Prescottella sp. R16]|uniref:alpha/beta hydrolase n=1 Tax=Prescottella sp. R16 TaxID=3064529 RepID=UPI00272DD252|nr:alpha/beta hydrolase [Prescottella sp. R16]